MSATRLEARLGPTRFVRVHRSELMAVAAVRGLRSASHGDTVAVLATGAEVRVSRAPPRQAAGTARPRRKVGLAIAATARLGGQR